MSSFIFKENDIFTFNEFVALEEAISPKYVSFGLNDETNDKQIHLMSNKSLITFFKDVQLSLIIAVIIHQNGTVGFGQSEIQHDFIKNMDSFSDKRTGAGQALKVFSNVMYVLGEMIKVNNINLIKFDGADEKLSKMYNKLMKNKFFIQVMKNFGFNYMGYILSEYTFKKEK